MTFTEKVEKLLSTLKEADEQPQDATTPAPQAQAPAAQSQAPASLPPEGYVDMVRLLTKALVMHIPPGSIDALFTEPITQENAIAVREGLQDAINTNANYEDNPERLSNPNLKKFENSINENNFMQKYKQLLSMMKQHSTNV